MRKIFTGEYIKALDNYTIEHEKVPAVELVDRAANAFVQRFVRLFEVSSSRIIVFAGCGNNGADALAIALELYKRHYDIEVFLFNKNKTLTPECEAKKEAILQASDINFTEVGDNFEVPRINTRTIVIDGIVGCGINRKLEGGYAQLVQFINSTDCQVVSIDIPSGMNPSKNAFAKDEPIIKATYTFTFDYPKKPFFFEESATYTGKVEVLNIGLSDKGKESLPTDFYETTDIDIDKLLKPRPKHCHKGTFGHALIVAGSRGKMGAAILAARGALRSGVGKLTAQVPEFGEAIMVSSLPEAMLVTNNETPNATYNIPLQGYDAIGIGPGLGRSERAFRLVEDVLLRANKPIVIDADAINIIAESRDLLSKIPEESIITPHAKEMERLTGYCETSGQRLEEAQLFASRYSVYVVLKAANTAICTPSGQVIFNPTGNPALATPGSGDVLTGIITSFLAQGYPPYTACILGTYLHGLAADYYAARYDHFSMLASDIAEYLPEAFKAFNR